MVGYVCVECDMTEFSIVVGYVCVELSIVVACMCRAQHCGSLCV